MRRLEVERERLARPAIPAARERKNAKTRVLESRDARKAIRVRY